MPSVPKETKGERMARIFGEENKAARKQKKKEEEAFQNAEAKKAKRAAKVAREATIPCKCCGKVQAECFCNGFHDSSAKEERRRAAAQKGQERGSRQKLTPEQQLRRPYLFILELTIAQDTVPEITKAHRALALINHPDKGGDSETMKKINAARDFLLA